MIRPPDSDDQQGFARAVEHALAALIEAVEDWELSVSVWDAAIGATAWFLSPEDVILFKLVYYRRGGQVAQKHPRDIAKMIAVSGEAFDPDYIERWARDLGVLELWRTLWAEDR